MKELEQAIVGFYQSEDEQWVARLSCGHSQNVKHEPPWSNRAWITTEQGRTAMLGYKLACQKCKLGEPKDWH